MIFMAADLVLPRSVARRFADGTVRLDRRWDVRLGRSLPRRAFQPPPRVDSAVLVIRRSRPRRG